MDIATGTMLMVGLIFALLITGLPLAVITNSLMPAILVEVGFLSNPAEERLLTREEFQGDVAQAVARAVQEFFQRFPPGGDWEARR